MEPRAEKELVDLQDDPDVVDHNRLLGLAALNVRAIIAPFTRRPWLT
jgi:hypothetical protein